VGLTYREPAALGTEHSLTGFSCRSAEQEDWLIRYARQSHAMGSTRVFVVTDVTGSVAAYYAWCMASVDDPACLPERMRKGAGHYPQPVALLARLGVDTRHEGRGLGAGLLRDIVARTFGLSGVIGCRGLLVHCESAEAKKFYTHMIPEFEESPTDAMHLYLLLKDIRRTLGAPPAPAV